MIRQLKRFMIYSKKKTKAWQLLKRFPNNVKYKNEHRAIGNKVTSLVRSAKRNYYWTKFSETKDTAQCWSLVNQLLGRKKKSIECTIKTNFGYNCDMEAIANAFNIEYMYTPLRVFVVVQQKDKLIKSE